MARGSGASWSLSRGDRVEDEALRTAVVSRAESFLRFRWIYIGAVAIETVSIVTALAGGGTGRVGLLGVFGTYQLVRWRGARLALSSNR